MVGKSLKTETVTATGSRTFSGSLPSGCQDFGVHPGILGQLTALFAT